MAVGPDQLVRTGDLITSDRIRQHIEGLGGCRYYKRDFVFRPGEWRGVRVSAFVSRPFVDTRVGLVVGHSDLPLRRSHLRLLKALGTPWVAGTNVYPMRGYSTPLPLGLTNDTTESPLHPVLGDARHLEKAWDDLAPVRAYTGSVYANFSVETAPQWRSGLAMLLKHRRDVVWESPDFSATGRVSYLTMLGSHDFVVCPRGNGLDTHRLWETIYMGGIPVVLRHPVIAAVTRDLPILMIEDWSQILDEDLRRSEWQRIRTATWDYRRASLSYWAGRMSAWAEGSKAGSHEVEE